MAKNNSVLQDLYYGKITPWENDRNLSFDMRLKNASILEISNNFSSSLSDEEKVIFENLTTKFDALADENTKDKFCEGFCLGLRVGVEVFGWLGGRFLFSQSEKMY